MYYNILSYFTVNIYHKCCVPGRTAWTFHQAPPWESPEKLESWGFLVLEIVKKSDESYLGIYVEYMWNNRIDGVTHIFWKPPVSIINGNFGILKWRYVSPI
jgi:hypothetical protein